MSTLDIAASGMVAGVARLDASASNTANAGSYGDTAPPFMLRAALKRATGPYQPIDVHLSDAPGGGVMSLAGLRQPSSFPLFDPSPPEADSSGPVASPNVDVATEIVNRIEAAQAYKLNISLMRTARAMEALLIDVSA